MEILARANGMIKNGSNHTFFRDNQLYYIDRSVLLENTPPIKFI